MSNLKTKRIALSTLFGVVIFISKIILPSPLDKMFIVIQALLLALASLLLEKMGATYAATIGGFLTSIWRVDFFTFTFLFAIIYGLLVDGSFYIFQVSIGDGRIKTNRIIIALTLSTAIIGILSTYVTIVVGLVPWMPTLYIVIMLAGIANGLIAGYLTTIVWKRWLVQYS